MTVGVLLMATVMSAWVSVAAAASPPPSTEVSGHHLTLQGHGTRSKFFFLDLYSVALYLPHPFSEPGGIWDASVAKALRVEILYPGSLPENIPRSWKRDLLPALTPDQRNTLAWVYASLATGDTIWVTYAPGAGTRFLVGASVVLEDQGDAVMRAFLDLWAGKNAVSRKLRDALIRR